jgi:hypothetical protein
MTRLARAWGALAPEQRIAAVAALALLLTMFFPWYDLQSLNRRTGAIDSRSISAFGDVSFVEAAVFLVAAGVIALLLARAERRDFHMPGSDGAVVMVAGAWAGLLIFFRVFSRPAGHGYPVGIEWGFFLAFVAAGALTWAGWRMRATSIPEAPLVRGPRRRRPPVEEDPTVFAPSPQRSSRATPVPARSPQQSPSRAQVAEHGARSSEDTTSVVEQSIQPSPRTTPSPPSPRTPRSPAPAPSTPPPVSPSPPGRPAQTPRSPARTRPRYPPAPSDQLSFEDPPPEPDQH